MTTTRIVTPSLIVWLALAACDGGGNGPDGDWTPSPPPVDVFVAGSWTLSGRGDRGGCSNAELDGSFTIANMMPLRVGQTVLASAPDLLGLTEEVTPAGGGDFTLSGTVNVDAVTFTTVESAPGLSLRFTFHGTAVGDIISGSLESTGPGTCTSSGTFEAVISDRLLAPSEPVDEPPPDSHAPADPDPGDPASDEIFDGDSPWDVSGDDLALGCDCRESGAPHGLAMALGAWATWVLRRRRSTPAGS